MVKILVAPDKFKGSLSAAEVCQAVTQALAPQNKFSVTALPLADGGEGTFEILLDHFKGNIVSVDVHDPLMRKIKASYGISKDGTTAFIEMAKASGLQLLQTGERDPLHTSTYGTGELISDAMYRGVKRIVLGIGGSATNDAGVGMASALGYMFFNGDIFFNPVGGKDLQKLTRIDRSKIHTHISQTEFITLCDVTNPFTGPTGAAHIYAAQKGATESGISKLEAGMRHFENLLKDQFKFTCNFEGAGAAGGLGAGAKFFLNSRIESGMDYVSKSTHLEQKVKENELVITGEGKLDSQSLSGKVVEHVTRLAALHGKKVIIVCGSCELTETQLRALGIEECLELAKGEGRESAMENAFELIKRRLIQSKVLRDL